MSKMTSTPKRAGKRQISGNPGDELQEVPTSQKKKLCILCGGPPATIEKDSNYDAMMQLYWCTLGVDVKPIACNRTDACAKCFDNVVKYFETNDIIVYFENYFKSLRTDLLKTTLKGIMTWEKEGVTLNSIQQQVKKKYGTLEDFRDHDERESRSIKNTLEGYQVECYEIVNDDDDGNEASCSRKAMKISKANGDADVVDKKPPKIKISIKPSNPKTEDSDDD